VLADIAYDAGVDPVTLLAGRFAIAGLCMVGVLRAGRYAWPRGRTLAFLVGLGAICYVTQSLLYFVALTVASSALVALLLYVYPAIVTIVAAALLREPLTGRKALALVVALGGTALTIGRAPDGTPLGIGLALGAAVAYAVYILLSSRVGPRAGAIPSATVVMLAAGAVLTIIALVRGPQLPDSAAGWAAVVGLALISTVVAIVAFFAGLERIGPAEASTVSTTEPVTAVLLAALVLGERLSTGQIVGGTLIVMAVMLTARAGRPDLVPEEAPPT
jgi:drug/metabolite transporter (DMT)-like permease